MTQQEINEVFGDCQTFHEMPAPARCECENWICMKYTLHCRSCGKKIGVVDHFDKNSQEWDHDGWFYCCPECFQKKKFLWLPVYVGEPVE